jgi:hypothetical protein
MGLQPSALKGVANLVNTLCPHSGVLKLSSHTQFLATACSVPPRAPRANFLKWWSQMGSDVWFLFCLSAIFHHVEFSVLYIQGIFSMPDCFCKPTLTGSVYDFCWGFPEIGKCSDLLLLKCNLRQDLLKMTSLHYIVIICWEEERTSPVLTCYTNSVSPVCLGCTSAWCWCLCCLCFLNFYLFISPLSLPFAMLHFGLSAGALSLALCSALQILWDFSSLFTTKLQCCGSQNLHRCDQNT